MAPKYVGVIATIYRVSLGHELVTPRRLDSVRTKRDNDAAEQRSFVFRAFGETIELHLEPDAEFLAGSLSVERISKGGRRTRLMSTDADQNNLKRCFYTGRTDFVRSKTASFNLCGGLVRRLAIIFSLRSAPSHALSSLTERVLWHFSLTCEALRLRGP